VPSEGGPPDDRVGPLERVEPPPPVRARPGTLRRWSEALVVAFLIVTFVATTVGIEGRSMEPSLRDGERALVPRYETWAARLSMRPWRSGDVVYFRAPGDSPRNLLERVLGGPFVIKRIVAVGGQTVALEHGRLLVDGEPSEHAPNGAPFGTFTMAPLPVPADHVYVLGDNRTPLASRDSRAFGAVPTADVAGRAAWVIWPPLRSTPAGGWAWNVRRVPRLRRSRAHALGRRRGPSAPALAAAV
jgi:signal peptidase I